MSFSIDLHPEEVLGTYANFVVISHSSSEFVLDFARLVPAIETPKVVRRIIMTPDHAKRLLHALDSNITRYEELFGEIKLQDPDRHVSGTITATIPSEA